MALPSPQDMKQVPLQQEGTGRLGGLAAPKLDSSFLDVINAEIDANNKGVRERNAEKAKVQLEVVKTKFRNQLERDALIPLQSEVANTKGLNTLDAVPKTREKLQKQIDKIKMQYPEQFHPYLEKDIEEVQTRFEKNATPHMFKETNDAVMGEFKVYTANRVNEAVEDSANPELFNLKLDDVAKAIVKQSNTMGLSAEQTDANIVEGQSKTILQAISFQATMGRLDIAHNTLKSFETRLTADDRAKAVKALEAIKKQMGSNDASALADEAYNKYPDNQALAFEHINSASVNDQVKRQAMAFHTNRRMAIAKQKEAQVVQIKAKIFNDIKSGKAVDQKDLDALPTEEATKVVDTINSTRGRLATVTNWDSHDELYAKLQGATTARDLPQNIIDSYSDRIAEKDLEPLRLIYRRLQDADNTEIRQAQKGMDLDRVQEMANEMATAKGIGKRSPLRGQIKNTMIKAYHELLDSNPRATRKEIDIAMYKALSEKGFTTKQKGQWYDIGEWFGANDGEGWVTDKRVPTFDENFMANSVKVHPSVYSFYKVKYPQLSESQINGLIKKAIESGVDVSKERKY